MIPNIYESPSESLNFQLQKLGFCGRKELKPLRAAGEKKKLNQLSHQHFQADVELLGSSKWKVGWSCGEGEQGSQSENGNWDQSQPKGSDRTSQQAEPHSRLACSVSRGLEELSASGSSNQSLSPVWR